MAILLLLLLAACRISGPAALAAGDEPAAQLTEYRTRIQTLAENAEAGVITRAQAEAGTQRYLKEASLLTGHPVTVDELEALPAQRLTALQRFAGLITFVNILWVLGIGLGVLSFSYLFGSYVLELARILKEVPMVVYEGLFYLAGACVLAGGRGLAPGVREHVGLTGCLLFMAALGFSLRTRKIQTGGSRYWALLTLVWAGAALAYRSEMLGFIAVFALLASLGFTASMGRLCYFIGFDSKDALGRSTAASFCLLALFASLRAAGAHVPYLALFERGGLFLGSFVGYLGLLIHSSRWYRLRRSGYWTAQLVTLAAGVAALFLGSYFGIRELQRIGGTFFVLYLLEKIGEIPVESKRGYAAIGLAISLVLSGVCWQLKSHPELARRYVLGSP